MSKVRAGNLLRFKVAQKGGESTFIQHFVLETLQMIDFHIHHRSDNRWRGCGAALLSCNPPVIVTAAHCLQGVDDPSKLRVIIIITVIVTIVIITTNP